MTAWQVLAVAALLTGCSRPMNFTSGLSFDAAVKEAEARCGTRYEDFVWSHNIDGQMFVWAAFRTASTHFGPFPPIR